MIDKLVIIFLEIMHKKKSELDVWYSAGKNSVRVRLTDGKTYYFVYNDPNVWKIETEKQHIADAKGGTKKK